MADVCIIGGGISGLTTAHQLMADHDVVVLERRVKSGGWMQSYRHENGCVVNEAPNGWLDSEPTTLQLIQSLGLESEIVRADPSATRWVWHNNKALPVPMNPKSFIKTPLLSFWAKLRILFEPLIPRGYKSNESLARLVERRLGRGVLNTLVAPMCAGIFAAKPEELSAEAAFPLLIELEKKYGSLLLGMNARKKEGRTKPRLTSLRNGAGQLTEALSKSLGKRIKYNCSAQSIQQHQGGWRVHTDTDTIDADVVILSCPAYVQARLLRGCVPDLSKHLEEIPYHNVVVAAAMMEKSKLSHPPDGFGVLVARGSELHGALGVLYSSEIFPDYAPENMVLTRSILGGSRYPEIADLDEQTIHHKVENIHRDLLGLEGRMDAVDIHVHTQSIPSYDIQHMRRQLAIRALQERHPGLYISGNHLFGIGVKDCIRNSYKIAQQVHHYIVPPTVA